MLDAGSLPGLAIGCASETELNRSGQIQPIVVRTFLAHLCLWVEEKSSLGKMPQPWIVSLR